MHVSYFQGNEHLSVEHYDPMSKHPTTLRSLLAPAEVKVSDFGKEKEKKWCNKVEIQKSLLSLPPLITLERRAVPNGRRRPWGRQVRVFIASCL